MLLFMIYKNHCFSLVVVNINRHMATKTCVQKLAAIKQLAHTCKCAMNNLIRLCPELDFGVSTIFGLRQKIKYLQISSLALGGDMHLYQLITTVWRPFGSTIMWHNKQRPAFQTGKWTIVQLVSDVLLLNVQPYCTLPLFHLCDQFSWLFMFHKVLIKRQLDVHDVRHTALFTGANMAVDASLYGLFLKPVCDGGRLICERVLLKRRITSDYDKTLQVWLALKCHCKH